MDVPMQILSEFMSPFEDHLDILLVGDGITKEETREIKKAFNYMRSSWNKLPGITGGELEPIKYSKHSTSDLYKNKITDKIEKNTCILYLDAELSKNTIKFISGHREDLDELEEMLIDKYLIQQPQEKYIFDVSQTSDEELVDLMNNMDNRPEEFNYILYDNLLGVWIYFIDEFGLSQEI
jgi:hypothetical protein